MIHLVCPNPAVDRTLLIRTLRPGLPNRPHTVKEDAGGKSFNVMRSLDAQANSEKTLIHTILGGSHGDYIKKLARQKNWQVAVTPTEKNTRECNIIIQEEDRSLYPIYEPGAAISPETLAHFKSSLRTHVHAEDKVVFSGSLLQGMPPQLLNELTDEFQAKNAYVLADTSAAALNAIYAAAPYALKINDEELQDLFPNQSIPEALREATPAIRYFIVTAGAQGVWARINGAVYRVHVPVVKVKNPIASGDFFLGVIAHHLLDAAVTPSDLLRKASAYATANCLSWFPEVDPRTAAELEKHITITELP